MKQRRVFVIASLILVLVLCTGVGTLAYFTDQKQVTNKASFGKLDVKTHELVKDDAKEKVGFTVGKDSAKCWVRLFVGIPKVSGSRTIYTLDYNNKDKWIQQGDYYYYKEPVSAGQTVILFNSIKRTQTIKEGEQFSNMNIIVYAEAVQHDNTTNNPVTAFELLKK